MKMDIWSNELTLEFIRLYEGEPALWNKKCPEHKNKYHVIEAWMRIKNKLKDGGVPLKELKKKRDNMMSVYRKLRGKVMESMENGSEEIYKPDWIFYSAVASFMDGYYNPRRFTDRDDQRYENQTTDEIMVEYSNQADEFEPEMYEADETEGRNQKQLLQNMLKPAVNVNSEDEYDLFCRSFAVQLKKLPEITALRMMQKMQSMMIEKKIELMTESEETTWLDIETNDNDPLDNANKRKVKKRRNEGTAKRMKLEKNITFESE